MASIPVLHETLFAELTSIYIIITSVSVHLQVTIILVYSIDKAQYPFTVWEQRGVTLYPLLALMFGVEPQHCSSKPSTIQFILIALAPSLLPLSLYVCMYVQPSKTLKNEKEIPSCKFQKAKVPKSIYDSIHSLLLLNILSDLTWNSSWVKMEYLFQGRDTWAWVQAFHQVFDIRQVT